MSIEQTRGIVGYKTSLIFLEPEACIELLHHSIYNKQIDVTSSALPAGGKKRDLFVYFE